jgi:N-acyl homoserine lactone hydrolase
MNAALPGASWSLTDIHLDTVRYPDWHPRAGEDGPVYVYILRSKDQVFLVDTGIGPEHPLIDRLYEPKRGDLLAALAKKGVTPSVLDGIIISHLHFDHGGGLLHFPGTPIYVQRAEWDAARAPKYTVPEFLDLPGANWTFLDGDTEIALGLDVLLTAGHTPGHQCVAVSTTDGLVVLAGQIVETKAEMDVFAVTGELKDWNGDGSDTERLPGAQRVLDLKPARVCFSHDVECWYRPF